MSAVAQPVAPTNGIARLRLQLGANKNALLETFASARPSAQAASALIRGLARLVDATLAELWTSSGMPAGAALVAAGGYGRGELFPHSDVDVLVLLPEEMPLESARPAVERFITAVAEPSGESSRRSAQLARVLRSPLTQLAIIFVIATAFRFWAIDRFPPGLFGD